MLLAIDLAHVLSLSRRDISSRRSTIRFLGSSKLLGLLYNQLFLLEVELIQAEGLFTLISSSALNCDTAPRWEEAASK